MKLTSKQESFARHFVSNGGNATQAAISAKYSKKTAYSQGQRLLKHVEVQEFIESLKEPIRKELGVTAEWIRKRLKKEAKRTGDGATHSARVRALELLGKDKGMFDEKPKEGDSATWNVNINRVNVGTTDRDNSE